MNDEQALKTINMIFKEIFGVDGNITDLDVFRQTFASDLSFLPVEKMCSQTGKPTWVNPMDAHKNVVSTEWIQEKFRDEEFMVEKKDIKTIEELFTAFEQVNTVRGESLINSFNCAKSTDVRESSDVYYSVGVGTSKNVYYSYSVFSCEYVAASADSDSATYCIRAINTNKCSNSFDVNNSLNVRNSFFVHNANDLKDCMFCHHIVSKQYCVANMQYTQEEYEAIKKLMFQNWPAVVNRYVLGRA